VDAIDLTALVHRAQAGDARAAADLFAATYPQLRKLARARLRGGGRDVVLDTTALVHEWYLRFARGGSETINDRAHFIQYASRAMRAVIVDFARRRHARKRGGDAPHLSITGAGGEVAASGAEEILDVHESLLELERLDPRMAQVVELRYFGGMTEEEIAVVLGITSRTVRRDWEKARLWLAEALGG
jgi:RNA polymerase sigma factor (TIGR02999 family)